MNYEAKITKVLFGKTKDRGELIWLFSPKWECDWYWSFGQLGNRNCHYHLEGYASVCGFGEHRNVNMFEALKADYVLHPALQQDEDLWLFCELAKTAYSLIQVAQVFGRGGSHYAVNPCAASIKNPEWVKHINEVLLPEIFTEIDKIFEI